MRRGILVVLMVLGLIMMFVGASLGYTIRQGSFLFDGSERARFLSMLHDTALVERDADSEVAIEVVDLALRVYSPGHEFRTATYKTAEEAAYGANTHMEAARPVVIQKGNFLLSYGGNYEKTAEAMAISLERVRQTYEGFSPTDYPINADAIALSLARLYYTKLRRSKIAVANDPVLWLRLILWLQTRWFNLLLALGGPLYHSALLRNILGSLWTFGIGIILFIVSLLAWHPNSGNEEKS